MELSTLEAKIEELTRAIRMGRGQYMKLPYAVRLSLIEVLETFLEELKEELCQNKP